MENLLRAWKRIEIIWADAWSDDAILKVEAANDLISSERGTLGYLVKEDADAIIISIGYVDNLYLGDRMMGGFWVIPRTMIKEIKVLDVTSIVKQDCKITRVVEQGCKQPEIVEGNGSTSPDSVTVGSDNMTWSIK